MWQRVAGMAAIVAFAPACAGSLAKPFDQMRTAPMTVYRLQNYEPTSAAQGSAAPSVTLPPQIQQWLGAGASLLPPGLLPPGLLSGSPPPPAPQGAARFHEFRILGWQQLSDDKLRGEMLDILGHESSFSTRVGNCMYAEFGVSIARQNELPADVLISLSCNQVRPFGLAWPYNKVGLTPDGSKRIIAVMQAAFGG